MNNSSLTGIKTAPRTVLLLPLAYLLHLAEEWFGGFSVWTLEVMGQEVSPERFILINSVFFLVSTIGVVAALRIPRMAWFAVAFASLLGLNGILHGLATLGFATYAPGVITGLLLYLPLSFVILRAMSLRLNSSVFNWSVLLGIVVHGLVFWLARL